MSSEHEERLDKSVFKTMCFTLNNPTGEEQSAIMTFFESDKVTRAVFQLEQGEEEETPHFQGYFALHSAMRFTALKEMTGFTRCHFERPVKNKNSAANNLRYCTKKEGRLDGPWIFPNAEAFPKVSGERLDLIKARQKIQSCSTYEDVINSNDPDVVTVAARHPKFAREAFNSRPVETGSVIENYYPWQQEVLDMIAQPADKRKIRWYYDPQGGCGKSTFAGVLRDKYKAQILAGSLKDVAYMLNSGLPIAIFDLMRSVDQQYVSYGSMESLKTGYIVSTKYESCVKYFKPMHVIVFSNHLPLKGKWSQDRYDVYQIFPNGDSVGVPYEELPIESEKDSKKRKLNDLEGDSVIGSDGEAMSRSYASNPANFKKRKTQEDEDEDGQK